ncbi:MAG: antitoxin [Proteobacteria bacterium]|nr:antitoxin [Pseudomonadota bacterium]
MKSMSIRGIDPAMADKLRDIAKKQGKSINQVVLETIQKSLGLDKQPKYTRIYDDLDHLFGKWTQAEFDRIQGKIESERTIDKELWQ